MEDTVEKYDDFRRGPSKTRVLFCSLSSKMSAREVHVVQFGAPASLEVKPQQVPTAGPNEVVVKMTMAPVNPADVFRFVSMSCVGEFTSTHAKCPTPWC